MQLLKNLALVAGVASVAAAVQEPEDSFDDIVERDGCPQVQVVALGGEGTTVGDLGYLDSTVSGILAAVPHSHKYQIGYPPGADSPTAISSGLSQLQAHIPKFASRCPNSKMFIMGYSAGSAAVMDTLCGDANTGEGALDANFKHNIIGIGNYGDPTFLRGKSYDRGTCTAADGVVPRQFPGHCAPFGKKMQSYCDENDPECCGGDDTQVHFEYPGLYDGDIAQFAKAKYTYWRRHM